jgi:DNA-binding FadR family transcriptional regulator
MHLYPLHTRNGAGHQAWLEHREIAAAIRDADPAAAAMRSHLINSLDRFRQAFS